MGFYPNILDYLLITFSFLEVFFPNKEHFKNTIILIGYVNISETLRGFFMKLNLSIITFVATSFWLSTPLFANTVEQCNIVEVIKNVNVRTKATKNSLKVGYLKVGQQYVETEQRGNWRRIWYHNKQRWVYGKRYLQSTSGKCVQITNTRTGHVNVRAEADKTSSKLGAVPESSWWALQSMEGNWAKVWYASKPAYIYKKYAFTTTSDPNPFKTRWNMTYEDGLDITLKTNPAYEYDFTVDWGDGTVNENVKNTIEHNYEQPGEYVISIRGQFPHLYRLPGSAPDPRLKSIVQWGNIEWQSMEFSFAFMPKLTHIETTPSPDLSNVESLVSMFRVDLDEAYESENLFNGDISNWDVSNVTDMSHMFLRSQFNGDISDWDVSNVTNMTGLFSYSQFNRNISDWNVSSVADMKNMFRGSKFNGDISNWDVSNVIGMDGMFYKSKFNGDISQWDVSNVTDMSAMFFMNSKFNGDISQWNVSNVTDMAYMFYESKFNGDFSEWDVSNVTDMESMFSDGNLSQANYDKLLLGWSQLPLQRNTKLKVSQYYSTYAKGGRDILVKTFGWNIDDKGLKDIR
jgi:surface protein